MAAYKQRKVSSRGRSPAPESKANRFCANTRHGTSHRTLKSGFGTYEAAEKAAKEIKKRYPIPQVTVFDAKKRSHTAIE
jgi:hypothetical protein